MESSVESNQLPSLPDSPDPSVRSGTDQQGQAPQPLPQQPSVPQIPRVIQVGMASAAQGGAQGGQGGQGGTGGAGNVGGTGGAAAAAAGANQQPTVAEQLATLTTALTTLVTQVQAQGQQLQQQQQQLPQQQPPAAAVAPQVALADTPGQANNTAIIDYTDPKGAKFFAKATAPLPTEFDMAASGLRTFQVELRTRAIQYGWMAISSFPETGSLIRKHDLFMHHGRIDVTQMQALAKSDLCIPGRDRQISIQMAECIFSSLSPAARVTLEASYTRYEVDPNSRAKSGPLLLWTIIDMLAPATRSIITVLTKQMTGLPDALTRLQFDVPKFHDHIRTLLADFGKQGMLDAQMIPYLSLIHI